MRAPARFARSIVRRAALTTLSAAAALAVTSAPALAVTSAPANTTDTIHATECSPLGVVWISDITGDHCFAGSGDLDVDFREVRRFYSGSYSGWLDGSFTRMTFITDEIYLLPGSHVTHLHIN